MLKSFAVGLMVGCSSSGLEKTLNKQWWLVNRGRYVKLSTNVNVHKVLIQTSIHAVEILITSGRRIAFFKMAI